MKSKDEMAKYYNWRRTPAPDYQPGDKVYLDASDIHMTRPSQKLSHKRLGPFSIVRKVGNRAYVKLQFNLENDRRKISGVEIQIEWIYVRSTELEV